MNATYDCQLTLVLPASLEEEVLEELAAHPEWVSGFSVLHGEGFGSGAHLRTAMERVRGRAYRRLVSVLMRNEHVQPLLDALRASFASAEVTWWTSPITGFGRLA